MRLTLSVLTLQDQAPFTSMTHTFDQSGGSVGRHQRASWVLLDDKKFLSGEHFSINCDGKDFFVVDTSTNGTFINDSIHPLGKNNSHRISESDQIRIGEYVILTSIFVDSAPAHSSFPVDTGFSSGESNNQSHDPFFSSEGHFSDQPNQSMNPSEDLLSNDPISGAAKSSFVDPNRAGTFGHASAVEETNDPFFSSGDSFSPNETPFNETHNEDIMHADTPISINTPLPASQINPTQNTKKAAEIEIPEKESEPDIFDFLDAESPVEDNKSNELNSQNLESEKDVTKDTTGQISPPETPLNLQEEANHEEDKKQPDNKLSENTPDDKTSNDRTSESLKLLLEGAGITQKHLPSDISNETLKLLGQILKETLQGTIELLRARAETKNHLHLDRTIIGRVENNPLKFMPNAEQVIIHLLTNEANNNTYTPLDKALEEAFDDIMAHQFSMTVASQNALKGVIKQHFSPKNLSDNISKEHPISSKIPLQRQAKLWRMFETLYEGVEKEATESFQQLLDKEISSAYEKQLLELKSMRINKKN